MIKKNDGGKEVAFFQSEYGQVGDEVDLYELCKMIWRGKWFIIGFTAFCVALAVMISFYIMTPTYKVYATIEPTAKSKDAIVHYLNANKFHRKMISRYDLLKYLYPSLWDKQNKRWLAENEENIPNVERALSEKMFPLKTAIKSGLIELEWNGPDPNFGVEVMGNIIEELRLYLDNEFISNARMQIEIYSEELGPYTERFEKVWDQFWELDKLTVASMEVLNQYARMKDRISMLKVDDALSKEFLILSEPVLPQEPAYPNRKMILVLSFMFGIFASIFIVLFYQFVKGPMKI